MAVVARLAGLWSTREAGSAWRGTGLAHVVNRSVATWALRQALTLVEEGQSSCDVALSACLPVRALQACIRAGLAHERVLLLVGAWWTEARVARLHVLPQKGESAGARLALVDVSS